MGIFILVTETASQYIVTHPGTEQPNEWRLSSLPCLYVLKGLYELNEGLYWYILRKYVLYHGGFN